jgi:hypothetical protein
MFISTGALTGATGVAGFLLTTTGPPLSTADLSELKRADLGSVKEFNLDAIL